MQHELNPHKIFFPNLDGLRFFSFFMVFLSHSFAVTESVSKLTWYKIIKVRMFSDGDIGVSFFFVLSGFLITYLLLKEREFTGQLDVKSFYIRRALRIWPLYYFCVFFGFQIFPVLKTLFGQIANETANPILCSTFLNNFDRIKHGIPDSSVLSVLWSVAIEEQFYLIWPILFLLVPVKFYKYIFLFVIFVSTLFRAFYFKTIPIDTHTLGVIADMAIGGFAAYLSINNRGFKNKVMNLSKPVLVIPYLLTAIFLVFRSEIFSLPVFFILKKIIMASTFAWIILEQNFSRNSFFKMSSFKVISQLGKYTYGLYCLHTIAILICITFLRKAGLNHYSWQIWLLELPISFVLSVAFSWLSFRYFESWFLKLKKRFAYISKE